MRAREEKRPTRAGYGPSVAALGGYVLFAFCLLALPILLTPGSQYVGQTSDPTIFIWSFAWWPYAIGHGLNPFVTHAVWAPDGVNLTWVTSSPALALIFAPVTLLFGPVTSYNTAAVLMPAIAAWFAFLLCRYLTRDFWASLVGGYLFGFSCYLIGHDGSGQFHLTGAALVPLVVLVVLRFLDGRLTRRGLVVRLGPLFALTLLISTEVTLMLAVSAAVSLAAALLFVPSRRAGIVALIPGLAGACVVAAVLTAPFLYFLLAGFRGSPYFQPDSFDANLLDFVLPRGHVLIGGGWGSSLLDWESSFPTQGEAYLGLPTLVIVGLFAAKRWRTPSGRFLIAVFASAVLGAMGAYATVAGYRIVDLPWALVHRLPAFSNILPTRFAAFASLAAAVVVALWAARASGLARWLLPSLAVLAIFPNLGSGLRTTTFAVQPFFTNAAYRTCLDSGEVILPLPIGQGEAMLWQAESGFKFDLAGGYLGPYIPKPFLAPRNYAISVGSHLGPAQAANVRSFIAENGVTSVVVDDDEAAFFTGALGDLGAPQNLGGVLVYHLSPTPPSCAGAEG